MKPSLHLVGAILLLAGCSDSPTAPLTIPTALQSASADVGHESTVEPFAGLSYSCDGEPMAYEGTMVLRSHTTSTPSGRAQLHQQSAFHAQGLGLDSGRRYVYHAIFNETQIFAETRGASTYDLVGRAHGVVQGAGDNDSFLIHAKWTINADGVVTVDFFDVEFECRG